MLFSRQPSIEIIQACQADSVYSPVRYGIFMMNAERFFWGSGEANSQTNSLYEAADRPNSLQTTLSVDFMVYKLYGLQNLRSVD